MRRFVALEGSGGAIYRYVGDEAIITWRRDEARDLSGAVEVIFRLRARIAARGEEYGRTGGELSTGDILVPHRAERSLITR